VRRCGHHAAATGPHVRGAAVLKKSGKPELGHMWL
jgi:hypothetical protein